MARTKEERVVSAIDFAEKNYGGKYFVSTNQFAKEIFRVDRFNGAGCDRLDDTFGFDISGEWHPDQAEGHAAVFFSYEKHERHWYAHAHIVNLSDLVSYRPATQAEIKQFRQVEREYKGVTGCDCCHAHHARMRMEREKKRRRR